MSEHIPNEIMEADKVEVEPSKPAKKGLRRFLIKRNIIVASGCAAVLILTAIAVSLSLMARESGIVDSGDSTQAVLTARGIDLEAFQSEMESSANDERSSESESSSTAETPGGTSSNTSSVLQPCSHTYVAREHFDATCFEQAYTVYNCSKCNYPKLEFYGEFQHNYGEYSCTICGAPNPATPFFGMGYWIAENKEYTHYNGGGIWEYSDSSGHYEIIFEEWNPNLCFMYSNSETREVLYVSFNNETKECILGYYNHDIRGHIVIDKSLVSSSAQFQTVEYSHDSEYEGVPYTEEQYVAMFRSRIDPMMLTIQNQMMYPEIGFRLSYFGFTQYA